MAKDEHDRNPDDGLSPEAPLLDEVEAVVRKYSVAQIEDLLTQSLLRVAFHESSAVRRVARMDMRLYRHALQHAQQRERGRPPS